jgi:hypothetical protein
MSMMTVIPTRRRRLGRPTAVALASALTAVLLAAGFGTAEAAAYLKLGDIKGDVSHTGTDGWANVRFYSFGVPSPDGGSGFKPMALTARTSTDYADDVLDAMRQGRDLVATLRFDRGVDQPQDDVVVDGRIVTAENYDASTGTLSFVLGAMDRLVVQHRERQRDGTWLATASGGWGIQGVAAFQGDQRVFDALHRLGAVRQSDGSLLIASAVPEPGSYALFAAGLALIALRGIRRSNDSHDSQA